MKIDLQYIAVGLIFIAAIYFIYKSLRKSAKGHACEGSNCNCSPEKSKSI
jgi:hypothetical protein